MESDGNSIWSRIHCPTCRREMFGLPQTEETCKSGKRQFFFFKFSIFDILLQQIGTTKGLDQMHHCISRVFTAKSRTTRCCIKWNANYLVVCYNGTQFNWYLLLLSSNVLHPVQLAGYSPSKYLIFKKLPLKIPLNHEWWCIKIRFSLSADEYNLEGIIRNTLWKYISKNTPK